LNPLSPREPQLDGLRCLAFLAVFAIHAREDLFPWGWGGVQLFFALSGFLITRILDRDDHGRVAPTLHRYYLRRTLRIFPLYYATIALIGLTVGLKDAPWLLTYTYNIKGFLDRGIDPVLGHFWSLCVEEQFYIVYPIALLLTPRRYRFALILLLIAATKSFQIYAESHWNIRAARILLPYCGEDLLWGGLAGLIDLRVRPTSLDGTACLVVGPPLLVLAWNMHERRLSLPVSVQDVGSLSLYAIACALIVFGASRCSSRRIVGALGWAPMAYLGRISYGLYVFHIPVLRSWITMVPYGFLIPRPWGALGMTIGLASLSWRYFEGPINRFKDQIGSRAHPDRRPAEATRSK
jgi:peptidoglycan/LPS O-acetylase OafA/YrhL